jgi:integrase
MVEAIVERHILDRGPSPDQFLLYPEKLGPEFYGGPLGTIWEDRCKQLSSTAMHRWWSKCLERAEIAHRPMHAARHTAITDFSRRTGNLKLAQMLAGHADIGTRTSTPTLTPATSRRRYARSTRRRDDPSESFRPKCPHLRGLWRRRESNPRPRTHRPERLQA